jgi:hypothetical protein
MSLLRIAFSVILAAPVFGADTFAPDQALIAHEWGTFTSVAGEDGTAVQWAPLSGTSDLPCFVRHLGPVHAKLARSLVRMETPVLYFYAPTSTILSVHVGFPKAGSPIGIPRRPASSPRR